MSETRNEKKQQFLDNPAAEQFLTLKEAADKLGVPVFKVTRAAKLGVFPSYTLFNSRRLVRVSEVVAAIESSRKGGSDEAK